MTRTARGGKTCSVVSGSWNVAQLLGWVGENLTEVRRTASGQRPVYWSLGVGLVAGLLAHVGGYALRASTTA